MNALNDNLGAVLMVGNTFLHFKDCYDRRDVLTGSIGNCYQYFAEFFSICNLGIGVLNILAEKANLTALKITQLNISLLETCYIIADPSSRMSRKEKIVRIATNIFQALRLLFESYISFSSPYKFALADPIWCTLLAFEFSARFFLFDQRRSKKVLGISRATFDLLVQRIFAHGATPLAPRAAQQQGVEEDLDNSFNLTKWRSIPIELEEDPFFWRFTCSITSRPIRYIVADPTAECKIYYERSAIKHWLATHYTSPVTGRLLLTPMLDHCTGIQLAINERLAFYSQRIREEIQRMI